MTMRLLFVSALFALSGCGGMTEPGDIAVAEDLCSKRGGFSSVSRYEHGWHLVINCNDGTLLDVRPPKRGVAK